MLSTLRTVPQAAALMMVGVVLVGCSQTFESPAIEVGSGTSLGAMQGSVQSGTQAVVGAHVYVYAAGTTGYGGAATSLLMADDADSYPTSMDASGNYYVTTDALGNFALSGDSTCDAGTQLYVLASGGSVGTGDPNGAIGMMAALGACPATGTMSAVMPMAVVNEVSTVAAAYAVAGFAVDATHVGSSGTGPAQTGIANAFANAGNLYSLSGGGGALAVTPSGAGAVPQATINTVANVLESCNGSDGAESSQCGTLFANAEGGAVEPTDTATAAMNIAHAPGTGVGTLYALQALGGAAFQPSLSVAPNDFTVAVTYSGGGLSSPQFVAIDAAGNAWVPNTGGSSVTEISSWGSFLSGASGFGGGGLTLPLGVAVDETGNLWVVNGGATGGVVEFSSVGTVLSGSGGYAAGTLVQPQAVAIDGTGNAWVASNHGALTELSGSGVVLVSNPAVLGGQLISSQVIALDGAGHVYMLFSDTDGGPGGALVEFSSTGTYMTGPACFADRPYAFAVGSAGDVWIGSDWTFLEEASGGGCAMVQGGGVASSYGIAIDGAGNAWATNPNIGEAPSPYHDSVSEFSSAGVALSPGTGYIPGGTNIPWGVAIDGSGDVWITNQMGNSVTEMIGAAVPVVTPLSVGVKNNTLGTRP